MAILRSLVERLRVQPDGGKAAPEVHPGTRFSPTGWVDVQDEVPS